MDSLRRLGCVLLAVSVATTACRSESQEMNGAEDQDQPQHFDTPQEAVEKARRDFLEVLRIRTEFNLGVDAATLERATAASPVRRVDVDFDRLLQAEPTDSLGALVQAERNTVVPLVADGQVATIVEIVQEERGWRVVGLAGDDIATELTAVRTAAPEAAERDATLYEVPNLQTRVYGVQTEEGELLFTDYGDFSIREPVTAEELLPVLRAGAVEFQRRFGDTLREQQLLR